MKLQSLEEIKSTLAGMDGLESADPEQLLIEWKERLDKSNLENKALELHLFSMMSGLSIDELHGVVANSSSEADSYIQICTQSLQRLSQNHKDKVIEVYHRYKAVLDDTHASEEDRRINQTRMEILHQANPEIMTWV